MHYLASPLRGKKQMKAESEGQCHQRWLRSLYQFSFHPEGWYLLPFPLLERAAGSEAETLRPARKQDSLFRCSALCFPPAKYWSRAAKNSLAYCHHLPRRGFCSAEQQYAYLNTGLVCSQVYKDFPQVGVGIILIAKPWLYFCCPISSSLQSPGLAEWASWGLWQLPLFPGKGEETFLWSGSFLSCSCVGWGKGRSWNKCSASPLPPFLSVSSVHGETIFNLL